MLHFMLTLLLLFISLFTTIIGIIFMIMPAENWLLWPQQWLAGTPFSDLRIPGLMLISIVGITNSWGFWSVWKEHPKQFDRAMMGGYALLGWVVTELLLSRELYLIHVSNLFLGSMLVLIAYQQKEKWAV
jgi:hypothetical protein